MIKLSIRLGNVKITLQGKKYDYKGDLYFGGTPFGFGTATSIANPSNIISGTWINNDRHGLCVEMLSQGNRNE